ncbi:hypothetical protein EN852_002675 [Mesorhizobium sp. M2E.F.Ca.ET.209.01.1.1]|uniref:hypothetical protein n=1 Tax=Mesorhizobium sp. M2E.F.Ca.ET.209.01.1.1 TaxID=2500526 RepID=UPI000FDB40A0|nr:hypothetical protein [Mesorhizobium sp. M2E.F.Ca.ET.209.01.1.1]TGS19236.1 hypothetical protein EN852_002675 [Mesorhizobium sp. M2E.F.Ca.ET.209.01.1.1]
MFLDGSSARLEAFGASAEKPGIGSPQRLPSRPKHCKSPSRAKRFVNRSDPQKYFGVFLLALLPGIGGQPPGNKAEFLALGFRRRGTITSVHQT